MELDLNKTPLVRLNPVQEVSVVKPASELYIGQLLKTVVVATLGDDQVLININGQNFSARSSHSFIPGELLNVKVLATQEETVLEVQHQLVGLPVLQSTLLQTLPKQQSATQLLQTLQQIIQNPSNFPSALQQSIKILLSSITTLYQLPQNITPAIYQSGVFFESAISLWKKELGQQGLKADFKALCFSLLASLSKNNAANTALPPVLSPNQDPLPGLMPQPLHKGVLLNLEGLSPEDLQLVLREQVTGVLARITSNQINHLFQDPNEGFILMLDLPIKTPTGIDIIPLTIKQHKAEPMQPAKWSLSCALSLPKLGDIQTSLSLYASMLDIRINAEHATTLDTLQMYRNEIAQGLQHLGLQIGSWTLHHGLETNALKEEGLRLLDLRA